MQILNPFRDKQQDPPTGYCVRCSGELWGDPDAHPLCEHCEEELADMERKAVEEAAECFLGKEPQWQ